MCNCIELSFMQFTANSSDYFGNRLRATELALFERLNATHSFDKTVWPTNPDFSVFPTLINAFYTRHTNQMCKHIIRKFGGELNY